MTHTNNPDTWEAETGGSLQVGGQPGLYHESQISLDHSVRFSFNSPTTSQKRKKKNKEHKPGTGVALGICQNEGEKFSKK